MKTAAARASGLPLQMQQHDEYLSASDIYRLTGVRDLEAQARELESEGIPFKIRSTPRRKWILVSRYHARQWLAGAPTQAIRRPVFSGLR